MTGKEVRSMIREAGVKVWQVADVLGIAPQTLSIRFRHDFTAEEADEVRQAIAQVKERSE